MSEENREMQYLDQAKTFSIQDDEDLANAAEVLKIVKSLQKEVDATFKPMKQAADKAKQEILDKERLHMGPLKEAETVLKDKALEYTTARDLALQRQREAQERAAREKAEAERAAEAARIWEAERPAREAAAKAAAEAAAKAEAERKRLWAEGNRKAAAEAKKRAEEAAAAEKKRQWEEEQRLEALKNASLVVAPPPPTPVPAKIAGISTRPDFDFEIVDKARVPIAFLMVDEVKVRRLVKQLGHEAAPMLPGIKIIEKRVMGVRAK